MPGYFAGTGRGPRFRSFVFSLVFLGIRIMSLVMIKLIYFQIFAWPGSIRLNPEPCVDCESISRRRRTTGELPSTATPQPLFPVGTIRVHVNSSLTAVVTGLKPWSEYTVVVQGYNNAGLGTPKIEVITTLDSSKYIPI